MQSSGERVKNAHNIIRLHYFYLSSAPKTLSFGAKITKIGPADPEIIVLRAIIKKRKKLQVKLVKKPFVWSCTSDITFSLSFLRSVFPELVSLLHFLILV